MKSNRLLTVLFLISSLISFSFEASAQNTVPDGFTLVDSVIYRPVSALDSTLVGKDFMEGLNVSHNAAVDSSIRALVAQNAERGLNGYRVRIFFDNKQSARVESEEAMKRFESLYHDVVAYRTYANPYFKVTVGDCRTRSEAMALLVRIKKNFPSAFVVKETISYPVVDKENSYIVDTVKVLRPVSY